MTARPQLSSTDGAQAAPSPELAATIENILIPRLLMAHRAGPVPPSVMATAGAQLSPDELAAFSRDLLSTDELGGQRRVEGLLASGVSPETLMLDLLTPVARHLGELWEQDSCDFVAVTVALGRMQRALHVITEKSALHGTGSQSATSGRVLLSGLEGEQHLLGMLIAAEFFARDEWDVLLGAPITERKPADTVQHEWVDVVGFSVGSDRRLVPLTQTIADIRRVSRNPHVVVMVGGPYFDSNPDAWVDLGADCLSMDAKEAPADARSRIAAIAAPRITRS